MSRGHTPTAYEMAGHYDAAYFADLATRYRRRNRFARQRIRNVFTVLPAVAGCRLLDVGCGMGTFTIEAARRGARAVGLDLAPAALPVARALAGAEQVDAAFVRGDAVNTPFAAAGFDTAIAADFTEHLDDAMLERTAAELARIVRPGGSVVVYTPSPSHFLERLRAAGVLRQDPSHIGLRSLPALTAAFQRHGFVLRRADYLPSHLPVLKSVERLLGRRVPLLRRRIGMLMVRGAGNQ